MKRIGILTVLIAITAVFTYIACSGDDPGFAAVHPGNTLQFPADHAAHPAFKTEWWYYTGHLKSKDGRRFGFQLTWFRVGLSPEELRESKFGSSTFYFAHFALVDKGSSEFHHFETVSRGGEFDDAGANATVLRTWIGDWRVERLGEMFYIAARTDTASLSLIATPRKPMVLQGDNGYSRKGSDPTNASMYYSYTRLGVQGVLELDGANLEVEGEAWMDHEFGSSQLDADQIGWDWFSIQLDNNEELMVYGLRQKSGGYSPNASGAYIAADGTKTALTQNDYTIEPLEQWESPVSGGTYPAKWRLRVPGKQLELEVIPYAANQELRTENSARVTYWEGAVAVNGTKAGTPVRGEGYVELTGYAGELTGLR